MSNAQRLAASSGIAGLLALLCLAPTPKPWIAEHFAELFDKADRDGDDKTTPATRPARTAQWPT